MIAQESNINTEDITREYIRNIVTALCISDEQPKLVVSVPELAKLLDSNNTTIYELVKTENFPKLTLGRKVVVPVVPLMQWIEKNAWQQFHLIMKKRKH